MNVHYIFLRADNLSEQCEIYRVVDDEGATNTTPVGVKRPIDEALVLVERLNLESIKAGLHPSLRYDAKKPISGRRYRGRGTLPGFLIDLMNDGERRTLDQVEAAVRSAPDVADQSRNAISTRLNELSRKPGAFEKLSDGSYQKPQEAR